jgi:hypothetical protein
MLTLKTASKIVGDIITFKLSIEPGAKITGNCKMSESEDNENASFTKSKEIGREGEKTGNKGLQDFGRYSGMAFQMIIIILVMTWSGTRLDKFSTLKPLYLQ